MIELKKTIFKNTPDLKNIYLEYAVRFFSEIESLNNEKIDKDKIIVLLNKIRAKYAEKLLFSIVFYQYLDEKIDSKDDIIKPALLVCFIDGIEEQDRLIDDLKVFLKRLENNDKLYLLHHIEYLQMRGENKGFKRFYSDLINKSKIYRNFPDTPYTEFDKNFKKVDKYMEKIAYHLYAIRNYILHEAKASVSVATRDEIDRTLISTFFGYNVRKKSKKTNKFRNKYNHFLTNIEYPELVKIVKRGVLLKIINRWK